MVDWTLVVAVASVVASCVVAFMAARLQKALIESQVYEHITRARLEFVDIAVASHEASLADEAARRDWDNAWYARQAAFLKAYDDACSKYLTRKVNGKWFERQYKAEICQLMESPIGLWLSGDQHDDYLDLKETYRKWRETP